MPSIEAGARTLDLPHAIGQRPRWSEAFSHPLRTFHTVRHLQPRQIVYQALRRVQPIAGAALAGGDSALIQRTAVPQAAPVAGALYF
jgi:hypothetical protein